MKYVLYEISCSNIRPVVASRKEWTIEKLLNEYFTVKYILSFIRGNSVWYSIQILTYVPRISLCFSETKNSRIRHGILFASSSKLIIRWRMWYNRRIIQPNCNETREGMQNTPRHSIKRCRLSMLCSITNAPQVVKYFIGYI